MFNEYDYVMCQNHICLSVMNKLASLSIGLVYLDSLSFIYSFIHTYSHTPLFVCVLHRTEATNFSDVISIQSCNQEISIIVNSMNMISLET